MPCVPLTFFSNLTFQEHCDYTLDNFLKSLSNQLTMFNNSDNLIRSTFHSKHINWKVKVFIYMYTIYIVQISDKDNYIGGIRYKVFDTIPYSLCTVPYVCTLVHVCTNEFRLYNNFLSRTRSALCLYEHTNR